MTVVFTAFNNMYHIYPNEVGKSPQYYNYIDPILERQIISCVNALLITRDSKYDFIEFTESQLRKCIPYKKSFNAKDMHNALNNNNIKYYYYFGIYRCMII